MSFYAAPVEFNLDCFGPEVRVTEELAAFASNGPDDGFVGGQSAYSRTRQTVTFRVAPMTRGEVDNVRHLWRQTNGGCRPVMLRLPGNQPPIHAILQGPLSFRQQSAGFWSVTFKFTEAF